MNKSNSDFISAGGFKCPICGKERYCVSTATFRCGYGSIFDGAIIHLKLCGDCVDSLLSRVPDEYIEPIEHERTDKVVNVYNYY